MASNECIPKSTDVTIHNKATEGTLKLVKFHYFNHKNIVISFPDEIPAGQSATFKYPAPVGAVVYRFERPNWVGQFCDWMLSWLNPNWEPGKDEQDDAQMKVYTEIKEADHYNNLDVWLKILEKLKQSTSHSEARWCDCSATLDGYQHEVIGTFRKDKSST